jgi:hypothetical protein
LSGSTAASYLAGTRLNSQTRGLISFLKFFMVSFSVP